MAIQANSTRSLARPLLGAEPSSGARLLPAASPRERLGLGALALRLCRLERALEISAFATMLTAWAVGYTLICPAQPVRHAPQHIAQVRQ